jgi:transcriptional regulator with XRE-family HTH domain
VPAHQRGHPLCNRVIKLLTEERTKLGMSKYGLAQKAGVSPQMIGYIESGERSPTFEILCRIADGLEVNLSDILQRAEGPLVHKRTER